MHDDEGVDRLHPADDWRILPDLLPNGMINQLKVELRRKYFARKNLRDQIAAGVGWTPSTPAQEKQAAMEYAGLVAKRCRQRAQERKS